MSQVDDFLDGGSQPSEIDSFLGSDTPKPASAARKLGDLGLSVAKGVVAVPETAVGLADLVSGGRAGKYVEESGVRFKDAKNMLSSYQSDDYQGKQKQFNEADGFIEKTGVALQNPSLISNAIAESVPLIGAGGVGARALMAAAPKVGAVAAGAAGEGIVGAGSSAEGIRQETQDGLLTGEQAGLAGVSGGATALFGAVGGKVAKRLGIADADTALAAGTLEAGARGADKGILRRAAEGALSEGVLEELPQSLSEQALQNVALGKDWTQDLDAAAAMGLLSGGAMGAGMGALSRNTPPPPAPVPPGPNLALDPSTKLSTVQSEEMGAPNVAQATPPDGRAVLNAQQAQQQLEREAQLAAQRAEASPDDEILASTGALDPIKPSQAMGIKADAGPLSRVAAGAVDGGIHDEIQQAQAVDQDQAAYDAYMAQQEADAQQQDTANQSITQGPLAEAQMSEEDKRAVLFSNQAVADGGRKFEGTQDGDILNGMGAPFATRFAAARRAKMEGAGWTIAPVFDGFVARLKDAIKETNSGTTDRVLPTPANGGGQDGNFSADGVDAGGSAIDGRAAGEAGSGVGRVGQSGEYTGQVSASPVAQGNPQPAKLGTQVSANAGPGFTAKDVISVQDPAPATNEPAGTQATPDAQAQAVGANTDAAEPAAGAGTAQVEANGVKAGDWVKPTVGNDTRPRQVDSVGSDGWVYTKSGDSFKPGQFEPTAQPVSTPITGGTGVAGNWEPPASQAPTKPAPGPASLGSAKADMDHLFGVDARRTKALERIAEGKAWFGNALKAGEFIAKNGLKGTHESVKTGDKHWDVRAKSEVQPVSQPQEQTNGTQAAQAQPQQTQPETGADTGISEPAAGTGVGGKAEGVEAKPATLKDAIAKVRAKKAAESQRLAPAQAQKLQEAHKANGPDVTLATVQRMYDRVMKSLITGKGSNGGTQYDIKPKERKELQAQADRLTNDLSLFGVQQEQPVGSGHTVENVAKAIQQKIASNRRKAQEKSRKEHEAKNWRPNSTPESEQAGYDAEVSAESREAHERSASALLGSDPVALIDMFVNGNFEASEDVFKEITGVRIRGLSAAGKKAALYKWANWTPEQIAQAEQDASDKWAARAEKFKQDDLKDAVRGAWMALDNLRVKTGDSEVTGQEYVTQTIASGFDQAHKQKNGVATIYGLTDGKRFTTLKAKPFTEFVKAAMAFGGLDKAMEYVNPPKLQAPAGFVDRSFDTASAKREPTEHAGLKIYPVNVKVGDKVEQKWGVQTLNNSEREKKGERQLGGDPLVDTLEGAKKLAEQEVEGAKRLEAYRAEMAALDDKKKEADAVAQAKKDANKGKSIAERRKDSILDGPTKLHPNAGLGTGTKREAMQKAVEQDRYIQSAMVRDEAAKKRDQESTERARRNNLPTGNINYPGVKEYFEAVARLKADDYTKPEYRVYDGRDTKGAFREISKTEYDYAQELKAKPTRETITPANDKNIGVNVDGNQLYEREDGSVYQMDGGKPRFSGFLEPVSASKEAVAPADIAQPATETVAKPERQYHLVAINEKTGAKTFLTRTPVTHAEAVTMKGKYDDKPGRRIQLEDVTPVEPASNPLDVPTDAQTQSTDAVKVGRFDHIQVPDETTRWMGFDGRKTVKADLQALAQRHSEYYQTAQQVRDDIEFVLGNPDGWYIHKDNKVVLFRERMGVGAIPQARVEVEAEADSMSVRSVYIGGKRQIAKKMADKKSILSGLDLGGQSPESLTISEYLKALGNGSSRPTSPSDEALKVVDSLTTADPEVKTLTPADVAAAEKQAIGVLQAAIDKMKAQEAQRFAARFLPTMGVKVPVGKARINAAMTDPKINLLGAADALNVSFAKSIVDTLEAKQEGRVADVADPKKVEKPVAAPIGDFGQKIGGAKKDTWTGFKDDLSAVKDDEIAGRKLSEIWPAPDYQKLIDDGMDVHSVAIIRSLRDEIPAKPRNAYKLSRWADQVQTLRALATNIMNGKDTGLSIAGFLERGNGPSKGIAGRADLYMAVGHDKSLEGIRLAHRHYSLYRGRENVNLWVAERDSGATAFSNWPQELATGDTKEDAIAAFKARYAELDSVAAVKKASFDIITETGKKGFFIGKKIGRNIATLAGPFDTVQEARAYRQSNLAALDEKLAKYKEIPKDRRDTNEPRVGEDMRNGQDVTPEMFAEAFGFKGVEFGNWVEQKRRQKDLNDAYDALMDMAAIMGVPAKAISLNGELGLAFGARGSGGVNPAAAHYESDKIVINLTKREGAGSLGHEWWHAVDNYFSRMRGGQTSPFMTTATDVGLSARGSQYVAYPGVRKEMIDAFGEVVRSIRATAMKVRSSKMDAKRTKEYWTTGEEMAARAFESYLISKLQDQDASNDYLANVVDQKTWDAMAAMGMQNEDSYPYPTAGEMPTIRAGFDKFFQTLETKETEGGNVAMFSRPTFSRGAQSQANESVERLATGIASHWENAPKVVVAFDMNDPIIPESVRKEDQRQRSGGATGTPEGFYYKGTVYLMSSKLGTPNDIARVLFHEALGHYGLRGTFGKALRPILRDVAMLRRAEVDAKIKQYGLKMGNTLDRFTAAEEVLAELAQTKPEIGFVQRAIAAIRTWLRQNVPGFNNLRLTDAELIRNYILPARAFVENGRKQSAAANGAPAFALKEVDGKSSVLSKDGKFQGWPKFNTWTRAEYKDVVSLLPKEYRYDSYRREPLPTQDRDARTAAALPEIKELNSGIGGAKGFGVDGLGNIVADMRDGVSTRDLIKAADIADKHGLGVFVTGVRTGSMPGLMDAGFVSEMGLDGVLARVTKSSAPVMPMASGVVNNTAYGTMMAYKPRGFAAPMFSRGTNDAMTNNDVVGNQGGRFTEEQAAEEIANDDDLFNTVAEYTADNPDVFEDKPEMAQRMRSILAKVTPYEPWFKTYYRGEPSNSPNTDRKRGFKSWSGNERTAKEFSEEYRDGVVRQRSGKSRAVALSTIFTARMRIRDGESYYTGDQAESFILDGNESTAPDSGGAMFSRSLGETLTSATNSVRDVAASTGMGRVANKAVDVLNERMSHEGTIGLWHKTFGSMYQLAKSHPPFKRVFDAAQNFINDVSYYASESADLAPKLLPKLEDWRDLTKTAISPEDNKAIEAPIFEGTLSWARDESGKPVKVDVLIEAAEDLTVEQKAQRLLRNKHITEQVLKMWQGMRIEDYEKNIDAKFERDMLRAGVVWKESELKSMFNLTGEKQSDGTWTGQIGLYKEFRNAIDSSLDNTAKAEMLRFAGKDAAPLREIVLDAPDADTAAVLLRDHLLALAEDDPARSAALTDTANGVMDRADKVKQLKKEGYAPLSRFGQYSVDVVVEGEREYFGLFETKHAANQMAAKMRIAYGAENVSAGTMSDKEFQLFQGITPESMELFGNMLGLDATGDKSSDAVFQEYLKRTKNNRSAMKRLIRRKGIAGFSSDTGRVLASFIYSNARMTSAGLHMGELDKAVQDIPKGSGQLKDAAIELREYIKNPREEAQAMRGLLFAQYLGGNVASMLMNFMQVPTVSLPYLSQFGGVTKATGALVKAMKDQKSNMLEKGLQQALKAADEKGITQPQSVHELMAQSRGSATLKSGDGTRTGNALAHASNNLSKFSVGWGKLFGMAEQINRRSTFIAAYRLGVEQGVPDPAAFAEKAVNETQFINNKANKAKFARGAIGGTLMTFKSYSTNYLELLYRLSTQNGPEGKKAALLMLGMLFLMAGAGGMPGAEDAEDLIDGIGQRMGYNLSTKKAKEKFLEETFGKPMAQFIMSGISGLPGSPIDISGRAGLGNLFPGTGVFMPKASHANDLLEFGGPAAGMLKRFGEAVGHLSTGNVFEAAMAASPVAIANMRKGVDMLDSGMYKDAKGYKVMDTTTGEALAKIAGFQPKAVKDDSEDSYLRLRTKNFYNEYKQSVAARWANGMFESDPDQVQEAKDMIASWNEKNPELPMRPNMMAVAQRLKKMRETREERILKGAPKVMQASIRQEIAAEKSAQ